MLNETTKSEEHDGGFLINAIECISAFLKYHTLSAMIIKHCKVKNIRTFSDSIVCIGVIISICFLIILFSFPNLPFLIQVSFLVFICYRVLEIIVTTTHIHFFEDIDVLHANPKPIYSYTRSFFLLLLNAIELINLFSFIYLFMINRMRIIVSQLSLLDIIEASFRSFFLFDYSEVIVFSPKLKHVAFFENVLGLYIVMLLLSKVIGNLPASKELKK